MRPMLYRVTPCIVRSQAADPLVRVSPRLKPAFIETLVTESPFETLDVPVLRGLPRLTQSMAYAVLLVQGHKRPASELHAVVGTHRR